MSTVTEEKTKQKQFQFQAKTEKLLQLMVSSIYSSKDIFLRELISNASDALDKLRFESVTNTNLISKDENLEIRIEVDKTNRVLMIHDNGIGMDKQELIDNIGTIAKSGTEELLEKLQADKNTTAENLIGQFGVGFYSVFMVSEKVTLVTKKAGQENAFQWESTGTGSFTIDNTSRDKQGTSIYIQLKPSDSENGLDDFAEYYQIETTVKKYSDFINYPIILKEEKEEEIEDKSKKAGDDSKEGEKQEENKKKETKLVIEDRTLNSMKPIWSKNKNEVEDKEYNEFYKHIAHDWTDPLDKILFQAEGRIDYTTLLYIPSKAPFDFFYQNYKSGLRLYVRKVLILDSCEDLLPRYLRFIKGVVDSPSLPLNISREMLQKDMHISAIRKGITTKILSTLKQQLEKSRDMYLEFWKEFKEAIKEGVNSDFENKDKLSHLLIFKSSMQGESYTSLKEYISRMKDDQKDIYYVTGDSLSVVENSPHLESFKEKGYEVLYLTDPIDDIMIQSLPEYEGKKISSIEKASEDIVDEKAKEKNKEKEKEMTGFLKHIQKLLDKDIKEVKLASNLISAPCCIKGEGMDLNPHLEKLLKKSGQDVPANKKILELNPNHFIVTKLFDLYKSNSKDSSIQEMCELLHTYSIIAEGGDIPDSGKFSQTLVKIMERAL